MKEVWVKADPWNKELVTTSLECGADAVMVAPDRVASVRALGRIKTIAENGDLIPEQDVVYMEICSAKDEEKIVKMSRMCRVIVKTVDWKIIPLENLVARTDNIFLEVDNLESARAALGVLEKGVAGLLVTSSDPLVVKDMIREAKAGKDRISLDVFTVSDIRSLGMGDRVCIDTCSLMGSGEGMLVGNSSLALFLVHAESIENPYVSPRPFRVNAGPVHAYVLGSNGRTPYLSDLTAGEEVMGIDYQGRTRPLIVGRVKIESRPLLLVSAEGPQGASTIIVQNAETIRLVKQGGEAVSVALLKVGDQILGRAEVGGRHFGRKIEESCFEK